jgi:hypothetical protein
VTYPEELIRLIDERVAKGVAAFAQSGSQLTGVSGGTINYRTGPTTCMVTLDGSALAVPVKVFGDVEVAEGDRVGLVRIGSDWTVFGTFSRRRSISMPDDALSGEQRMIWGADTPAELQAYGLTVAMQAYTIDAATGIEVGYFYIAVSNIMDTPDSRALVFGNVTYPTPGNPATATVSDVKTNFQLDMFGQFPLTIFKDHSVRFFPGVGFAIDDGDFTWGGVSQSRGRAGFVASTAGVGAFSAETTILNTGNVTFAAGRAYKVEWELDATGNAAYVDSVWHLRRTNITGALLRQAVGYALNNTDAVTCRGRAIVRNNTGSNIVTPVLLTGTAPLGGTITVRSLAAGPYYLMVTDLDAAAVITNVVQV